MTFKNFCFLLSVGIVLFCNVYFKMFQFQIGSIKSYTAMLLLLPSQLVSIPNWFD